MKKLIFILTFALLIQNSFSQVNREALLNPKSKFWTHQSPEVINLKFTTTKGAFTLEVHRSWAPRGADRLYNLARAGFFDDSRFYRVREGFIAQFGIAGTPEIAKVWEHESFEDDPVIQSNLKGYVAYAMTGPNARTTQLYISLKDNNELDKQGFAPLAKVVDGMDVVLSIYAGYGETSGGGMRAGKQAKLFEEGNAWLDRDFPKLDKLIKVEVIK